MKFHAILFAAASGLAVAASSGSGFAAGPTIDDLMKDQDNPKSVLTYGLGTQGQRFSPLATLNKTNIKNLIPAWAFSFGGEKQRGQEAQPIVYDGMIYVTASYSRIFAVNAKTGDKVWEHEARLPEGILPCCDVINRGAAILGDKIFFGSLDAKLVALDRMTGKVLWRKTIDEYDAGYSYSAAPLIVPSKRGPLLVTGLSGGEFGVVGRVEARNPENGELVWSRPVIEGHMGMLDGKPSTMTGKQNESWPGDMWKTGGGATWLGGTYDPETNSIFFGTGNPAPWNSYTRPGDNKWSSSRLALDPDTGEIKWGFQTTPHDGWDFDGVNELVSFDLKKDGKTVKAAATADRNGFFYVLDRTSGKFISAHPFVKNITWAKGIGEDGRPIYTDGGRPGDPAQAAAGEKQGKSVFSVPSFLGGKNWMPMAYSKQTGLFYVPSNEWGMDIWNEGITYKKGAAYLGAGFTIKPIFEDHIGSLKAIDPATGAIKWEYKNKAPLWGGVLTTAGGLVFTGTPEGYLKAFDAETGEEVWKFNTGSGIVGSPVTWEQDGEQWVGVVSGWGGAVPLWGGEVAKTIKNFSQGGMMWAFRLPKQVAAK